MGHFGLFVSLRPLFVLEQLSSPYFPNMFQTIILKMIVGLLVFLFPVFFLKGLLGSV